MKRIGMLGSSVRKVTASTVTMDRVTPIGKGR